MRYCVKPASVHKHGREQESLLVGSHMPLLFTLHTWGSHYRASHSPASNLLADYTACPVMNVVYTFRFTHYRYGTSNLLCLCS